MINLQVLVIDPVESVAVTVTSLCPISAVVGVPEKVAAPGLNVSHEGRADDVKVTESGEEKVEGKRSKENRRPTRATGGN